VLAAGALAMSDAEDYDDGEEGAPPPAGGERQLLDERGFPIGTSQTMASSGGGRLVARENPLQQKLEKQKREAEEKAKAAAKKASLQTRLAAFGGGASAEPSPKSPPAISPAAPPPAALAAPAEVVLDSRVMGMMKSACGWLHRWAYF
jgi:hypothetical protein